MNAIGITGSKKKLVMWYKCKELSEKNLKKSQIARELGLSRKTVSKYLKMSGDEFLSSQSYHRDYPHKLEAYEGTVKGWVDLHHDLSASQVYDWLREKYGKDMPDVSVKTVYNFVRFVRFKYGIEKPGESSTRQYSHLEETEYGEYAQADFGEMWMSREGGRRVKVYFFVMVLCRSRKKYVWFNASPFTSEMAIYAHEKAFEYFGGKPRKIIYDQDAVLIHDENMGDYVLTKAFDAFVGRERFECVFCRKSDPESKGKVENAVKYVKYNFLRGRTFTDISSLNEAAIQWLSRTANGLRHGGTGLVPDEVFKEERHHLTPYTGRPMLPERTSSEYSVHKDNTLHYHGSTYSLPLGTYAKGRTVWVSEKDEAIEVYSKDTGKLIARHKISGEKGKYVMDASHRKVSRVSNNDKSAAILKYCNGDAVVAEWLDALAARKPRYYSANLRHIMKEMVHFSLETIHKAFEKSLDKNVYNARDVMALCGRIGKRLPDKESEITLPDTLPDAVREAPVKNEISSYSKYFQ